MSTVVVFHFTDADPAGTASDYVATVNTGDATLTSTDNPSNVKIVASGDGFDVQLTYTYAEELTGVTFGVSVTIHNTLVSTTATIKFGVAAPTSDALTPPTATEGAGL